MERWWEKEYTREEVLSGTAKLAKGAILTGLFGGVVTIAIDNILTPETLSNFSPEILPEGGYIVDIKIQDPADAAKLLRGNFDLWDFYHQDKDYILTGYVTPDQHEWLQTEEFEFDINDGLINNVNEFRSKIKLNEDATEFIERYKTVEGIEQFLSQKAEQYEDLMDLDDGGDSWRKQQHELGNPDVEEGSDIWRVRLTNKSLSHHKPKIFLNFGAHAREILTPELALKLIDDLLSNYETDPRIRYLLDNREIYIVPLLNPDGHREVEKGNILWRKNTEEFDCEYDGFYHDGKDLARIAYYQWKKLYVNMCYLEYQGDEIPVYDEEHPERAPAPEAFALWQAIREIFPEVERDPEEDEVSSNTEGVFVDVHAYGREFLFPWMYRVLGETPNHSQFEAVARKLQYYADEYQQGLMPYEAHGNWIDDSYARYGVATLAIEAGSREDGFFPPAELIEEEYQRLRNAFLWLIAAADAPYQRPFGTDPISGEAYIEGNNLVVQAAFTGYVTNAEIYLDIGPKGGGVALEPASITFGNRSMRAEIPLSQLVQGKHVIAIRGQRGSDGWGVMRGIEKIDIESIITPSPEPTEESTPTSTPQSTLTPSATLEPTVTPSVTPMPEEWKIYMPAVFGGFVNYWSVVDNPKKKRKTSSKNKPSKNIRKPVVAKVDLT